MLPYPEFSGWTMVSEAQVFDPSEIQREVGQYHENFVEYGFVQGAWALYRNDQHDGFTVRLEILDMGTHLNAFGMLTYLISRLPEPELAESPGVVSIGETGFLGHGYLYFFKENIFIRLILNSPSLTRFDENSEDRSRELLPPLARFLARSIQGQSQFPPEINLLPRKGRVRRTEMYSPDHLLDIRELGPGISSQYGDPGPRYHIGVTLGLKAEKVSSLFRSLTSKVQDGQVVEELGEKSISGRWDQNKEIIIVQSDKSIILAVIPLNGRRPRRSSIIKNLRIALDPEEHNQTDRRDPRPWKRTKRVNQRTTSR